MKKRFKVSKNEQEVVIRINRGAKKAYVDSNWPKWNRLLRRRGWVLADGNDTDVQCEGPDNGITIRNMNCILKPKRGRHLRQDGPHPSLTAILRFRTRITSLVLNGRSPD